MLDRYFDDPALRASLRLSVASIRESVLVDPIPLQGTLLEPARVLGVTPVGGMFNGAWTGLARAMEHPTLGRVVLEEYNYRDSGTHVVVPREFVDGSINELPMQFLCWETEDDRRWTEVRWFTRAQEFRLYVGTGISKSDKAHAEVMRLMEKAR